MVECIEHVVRKATYTDYIFSIFEEVKALFTTPMTYLMLTATKYYQKLQCFTY